MRLKNIKIKYNKKKLILLNLMILTSILVVMAVTVTVSTFDDRAASFELSLGFNYEQILKSENISYYDDTACGFVSHGCKWWNYTLDPDAVTQVKIELLTTNYTAAADCVKNPFEVMVGQTIVTPGPVTTQAIYCVNSTDGLVSLGSKQTTNQDFVLYYYRPFQREYLTIPLYAYVQNITLNLTGEVDA